MNVDGERIAQLRDNIYIFIKNILPELKHDGTDMLLEVGAGNLKICKQLIGPAVKTQDLSGDHDLVGDICKLRLKEKLWDVIFMIEVLEHIETPQAAIDNLYSALKDTGIIVLSVPFAVKEHNPKDYWRFTKHGLDKMFKKFKNREYIYTYFNKEDWVEGVPLNIFMIARKGGIK